MQHDERTYLAAILRSGGLSTRHRVVISRDRDNRACTALLVSKFVCIEYGRIYATAAGCVAFGPVTA